MTDEHDINVGLERWLTALGMDEKEIRFYFAVLHGLPPEKFSNRTGQDLSFTSALSLGSGFSPQSIALGVTAILKPTMLGSIDLHQFAIGLAPQSWLMERPSLLARQPQAGLRHPSVNAA